MYMHMHGLCIYMLHAVLAHAEMYCIFQCLIQCITPWQAVGLSTRKNQFVGDVILDDRKQLYTLESLVADWLASV